MSARQTRKLNHGRFGMFNPLPLLPKSPRTLKEGGKGKKMKRGREDGGRQGAPQSRKQSGQQEESAAKTAHVQNPGAAVLAEEALASKKPLGGHSSSSYVEVVPAEKQKRPQTEYEGVDSRGLERK
ncbi:hypothetical protein G6514_002018 [Epicoccum nigrum]|nr:hypothetical protein G6514_002018 [Epicoccum nigrum]